MKIVFKDGVGVNGESHVFWGGKYCILAADYGLIV